jgi:TonB family protein
MTTILRASFAVVLFLLASASLAQAPPASEPYRVGGEVTRPEKVSGDSPAYTEIARKARVTGVVIVEAVIDEQGNVTDTRVLKGLPMGLDRTAVEAVETWKFKPATLDGRPVPVYFVVTVNFQLDADFSFGPRFGKLMQDDPELGELVRGSRYQEALDLLDRRPASPESRLARSYVLLGLGRVRESWKEVQAFDSPEHELLYSLGEKARNRAAEEKDEEARAEILEAGLQALTRALEVRKDDYWTLSAKSRLLWEKAQLTEDQQERQELLDEGETLSKRADEVRPKPAMPPP